MLQMLAMVRGEAKDVLDLTLGISFGFTKILKPWVQLQVRVHRDPLEQCKDAHGAVGGGSMYIKKYDFRAFLFIWC